MDQSCSYCKSPCAEGEPKCKNCGAPIEPGDARRRDYRHCPSCKRRLLALASPACNYCGLRLPESYIKAREDDLKRIVKLRELEWKEPLKGAGRQSILPGAASESQASSILDLLDVTDLISFFSE